MKFERVLSAGILPDQSAVDLVEWRRVDCVILNADGSARFAQSGVEVPEQWSQHAANILAQKYFRKAGLPGALTPVIEEGIPAWLMRQQSMPSSLKESGETSAHQVFHRLAGCWTYHGWKNGYFSSEDDARVFYDECYLALALQLGAPNSPQWFNTGLHWAYGIEGEASGQWAIAYPNSNVRCGGLHQIIDDPKCPRASEGQQLISTGAASASVYQTTNSYEHPQPHACFIQHVSDELVNEGGIFDLLTKEARLFKHGSGTGSNFSSLRGPDEMLSGGGRASGMMSFLEVLDRAAGAIKSGGTTRRAAKMVICNMDHPEIESFIDWKVREESKAASMYVGSQVIKNYELAGGSVVDPTVTIPDAIKSRIWGGIAAEVYGVGWEEEARESVSGQNSNNSLRVTNDFLRRVDAGRANPVDLAGHWELRARTTGETVRTVTASGLWDRTCLAAWACGDPGVQFHDTINEWHTCPNDGEIEASNPCSEYLFLDDTACNLASLNLARFRRDDNTIDLGLYEHVVRLFTVVLDISVQMASFPSREIAVGTYRYRTLGLGPANVGGMLMRSGLPYDSDEGRALAAGMMALMTGVAYRTSAEMAAELGAFPRWEANEEPMRRVLRNHRASILTSTRAREDRFSGLSIYPMIVVDRLSNTRPDLFKRITDVWHETCASLAFRNAQVTVCAPTGTISFVLDCDTNGVEPEFALIKYKHLAGGGQMKIVNPAVPDALRQLGYDAHTAATLLGDIKATGQIQYRMSNPTHQAVFWCSNPTVQGEPCLRPMAHVLMVAALQPFVSGGISKTINLPSDATVEDVDLTYREAHRLGVKCVALFRDGCKLTQPLNVSKISEERLSEIAAIPDEAIDTSDIPELPANRWPDLRMSPGSSVKITGSTVENFARRAAASVDAIVSAGVYASDELPRGAREFLPWRRESGYRQKAKIGEHGQSIYWSVSNYEDGRPGEIFITLAHEGSTLRAMAECLAIAMSDALQHGTPLGSLVDKYLYTKFEPSGMVEGHDRIRFATSIADLIARDLAITYLGRDDVADVRREPVVGDDRLVALDRRAVAVSSGSALTGNECPRCGGMLVRDGSCVSCQNCDYNTGCGG